ncbi:UNVERIFIED_ORG: helix-turn-helix protein [Herbaspirillum seropedicae]
MTQLGKELKKLRIDLGMTLMEMARKLDFSAAFLSAVESGRKRAPEDFLQRLSDNFEAVSNRRQQYETLINQARKEVVVPLDGNASFEDAELATMLARRFNTMSHEEKEGLRILFGVDNGKKSN